MKMPLYSPIVQIRVQVAYIEMLKMILIALLPIYKYL